MTTNIDILSAPATALANLIATRDASSAEIVDACLRRIAEVNPRLNAVVQIRGDQARAEAKQADAELANGHRRGALHGVPVTVKDAFDVAGMRSTCGTRGRAEYMPPVDATAVKRLKEAGAIVLGLTNTPELTLAYETDNLVYGRTNNPYDLHRTPGGSSGGEAAVIAAGGSPLGIGTDIGGSVRVPAHFCGITSIKPTLGRVPTTGVFPPAFGASGGVYHVGPLARSVADLQLALEVLSGPDGLDPRAVPAPLGKPSSVDARQLRVAYYTDNGFFAVTAETARAVRAAAEVVHAVEARPEGIQQTMPLFGSLLGADDGATVQQLLHMVGTTEPSQLLLGLGAVLHQFAMSAAEFAGVLAQIDILRAQVLGFLTQFDAIVSPVTATPAVPHGATLAEDVLPGFSYSMLHSLTGLPAAVVRAGAAADGLPIGVQIVARPWREDVALALAQQVESALGGWQPPTQ